MNWLSCAEYFGKVSLLNLEIMGGEGSMAAANNSLKNNRNLLAKRKEKSALRGSYSKIVLKKFPKPSEEQLTEIKERLNRENKALMKKQILVFLLVLVGSVCFCRILFY